MNKERNTKNQKIESIEPMILMSASGADINGTEDGEILIGFGSGDTVNGLGGDDTLIGLGGDNVLNGGDGDDRFITVYGDNVIDGGDGNDVLLIANGSRDDFEVIDRGNGIVEVSSSNVKNFITNVEFVQFGSTLYSVDSLISGGSGNAPVIVDPENPHIFISENTSFVVDVNATDLDGDTLTYSIVNDGDGALFQIDPQTGELSFKSAPDFECPKDTDGDNTYDVTVVVSDGTNSVSTTLWVTVQDVNESTNSAPEFTNVEEGEVVYVNENTTFVGDADATDADGDTLTFSISDGLGTPGSGNNEDAGRFVIDPQTGVLSFLAAPDFENPSDADGDNTYHVTLVVSDGNAAQERKVVVKVLDVNESSNTAPVFTNVQEGEIVDVAENTTLVGDANATDADGDTLTYSISGGADASKFTINSSTGVVSFATAPDFEAPTDADGNNQYQLTLKVSDGNGGFDEKNVVIRVTDVNESSNTAPVFTNVQEGEIVDVAENTTLVGDANATDADGDTLTYSISGGADASKFTINSSTGVVSFATAPNFEAPNFEAPTDADGNNRYELTLKVSDGNGGFDEKNVVIRVTDVNESSNTAPVFTNVQEGEVVDVAENTTLVGDANATDADGDTLTYSISGGADASKFTINSSTGVVSFVSAPDFEAPTDADGNNQYQLTLKVSDGNGGFDEKNVVVRVNNVNEGTNSAPQFTNVYQNENVVVNEGTTFVGDADATDARRRHSDVLDRWRSRCSRLHHQRSNGGRFVC